MEIVTNLTLLLQIRKLYAIKLQVQLVALSWAWILYSKLSQCGGI